MSARTATPNSSWRIPPIGLFIILIVLGLTFLGLVILFSASQSMHDDPTVLLRKQLIWLVLATIAGGIAMVVNLEALREYAYWLAAGSILLLLPLCFTRHLLWFNYFRTRLWHCLSLRCCGQLFNVSCRGQTQVPYPSYICRTFAVFGSYVS